MGGQGWTRYSPPALSVCAVGAYDRATYHAAQPATTFRSNYEDGGLTFAGR